MSVVQHCITPEWPAPANVRALQTTRNGGVSVAPYASLNLGSHVGDNPLAVSRNRMLLAPLLPSEPVWLNQVHGISVADAGHAGCLPEADASVTKHPGAVCVVMTADCLPVLLCDDKGSVVGAAHAGWRGLCDGVLESTVSAMIVPASTLMAWLGPAIGPGEFEVGDEVRAAFVANSRKQPLPLCRVTTASGWLICISLHACVSMRLASHASMVADCALTVKRNVSILIGETG